MSNTINSTSKQPAILSVETSSSVEYQAQVAQLQGDINDIYNEMLLNDYDKNDLKSDINSSVGQLNEGIDDLQAFTNEEFNEEIEYQSEILEMEHENTVQNIDNFVNLVTAVAGAYYPEDPEVVAAYTALAVFLGGFMEQAAEKQYMQAQHELEQKQERQQMINTAIDKFQEGFTKKANEIPEQFEEGTKELLAAETEANGGKTVSGSGTEVTIDGSTNQDLYIEGSGNTIVINGDYQGDIVMAPDATDNTIIINGNYGSEGDLSMGGKNNTVEVNGNNNANMTIGGDGNTVKATGDVTGNVGFGGEGNSVQYGEGKQFTGTITQNSDESNTVKKIEIEELEGANANLQNEANTLQNQLEDAQANASTAAAAEQEQEDEENSPAVDPNGIPLAGSSVGNA